jgi:hypothetical protein
MAMGMVTVWLWDADGPARSASGVTDHDGTANGGTGNPPRRRRVDAIRLPPHRNRMDRRAPRQSGQVEQVPPAGKGRVMTASEQAVSDLERDIRERYPRARVTVTAEIDRVTVEVVSKPDDSFKVTVNPDRIGHGSTVLARIFRRF